MLGVLVTADCAREAHELGATWAHIGSALGMSPEGAHKSYSGDGGPAEEESARRAELADALRGILNLVEAVDPSRNRPTDAGS